MKAKILTLIILLSSLTAIGQTTYKSDAGYTIQVYLSSNKMVVEGKNIKINRTYYYDSSNFLMGENVYFYRDAQGVISACQSNKGISIKVGESQVLFKPLKSQSTVSYSSQEYTPSYQECGGCDGRGWYYNSDRSARLRCISCGGTGGHMR